jgi:peptidase M28-like protein/type IX secretion system substrate protein
MPQLRKIVFAAVAFLAMTVSNAQVFIPFYGSVADQCSASGILANLTEFQNLGVKYRGTASQANTLNWLRQKYLSYGYTEAQITEDPFTYSGSTCKNLVVTKIGTLYPNTFVIIDGHYDTVTGTGTNDNGSGVCVILEIARLLQNIPTEYSIKFINFAGEEDGLVGSQHYVNSIVNGTAPKMDIRLLLNIDEVGGVAGMINNTITCERDQSNSPTTNNAASAAMTTQLSNCMELYSPLETTISFAYASDYMPFEDNDEIITGLFETNETPYAHTVNDNLANMDPAYVFNVAKGTTGAALHFAVACVNCNLAVGQQATDFDISLYPNPAKGILNIHRGTLAEDSYTLTLVNILGKTVYTKEIPAAALVEQIPVDGIGSGIYMAVIDAGNIRVTKKIIIE